MQDRIAFGVWGMYCLASVAGINAAFLASGNNLIASMAAAWLIREAPLLATQVWGSLWLSAPSTPRSAPYLNVPKKPEPHYRLASLRFVICQIAIDEWHACMDDPKGGC